MLKDDYAATIARAFHRTTYGRWLAEEGVTTFEDWAVQDLWKLETAPWPRMDVNACFINLYALMEGRRGLFVADIPPGGATDPIHHLYEEMILILDGHGTTEIWQYGERRKHVLEWGRGSVFSPPLNTWFRLYNLSNQSARFLAFNRAPSAMNEFNEPEFILDCPYTFRKRFSGQDEYFAVGERKAGRHESSTGEINNNLWESNFILDAFSTDLHPQEDKVISGRRAGLRMAGNLMMGHIMEWPVGHYQKAHYHDAGAALLGLRSEGYVLMWPRAAGNQPYSSGHSDQVWRSAGGSAVSTRLRASGSTSTSIPGKSQLATLPSMGAAATRRLPSVARPPAGPTSILARPGKAARCWRGRTRIRRSAVATVRRSRPTALNPACLMNCMPKATPNATVRGVPQQNVIAGLGSRPHPAEGVPARAAPPRCSADSSTLEWPAAACQRATAAWRAG